MNLLIDTNILIWIHDNEAKLSKTAKSVLNDREHNLYLSVVSIWEIQIKLTVGKLNLSQPVDEILDKQQQINDLKILNVTRQHAVNVLNLPLNPNHKDPFDRMLISQAIVEDMTIVTADPRFSDYAVKVFW